MKAPILSGWQFWKACVPRGAHLQAVIFDTDPLAAQDARRIGRPVSHMGARYLDVSELIKVHATATNPMETRSCQD